MQLVLMGGSLRPASFNARLMGYLGAELRARGHETSLFAGAALRLPLYEAGLEPTAEAAAIHEALQTAQGLVIVSPEYNASVPGFLKNAMDWLSTMRPSPWSGLPVMLAAASPGAFGGVRALAVWRTSLANLGVLVLPEVLTVPHADEQLDERGAPTDPRTLAVAAKVLDGFLALASRLKAGP